MTLLTTNKKCAINYSVIIRLAFTCSIVLFASVLSAQNVTTFAGTVGSPGLVNGHKDSCQFNAIEQMAFDSHGNLFIADFNNNVIRKLDTAGMVSTYAGNGNWGLVNGYKDTCEFASPSGIAIDKYDNIYISVQSAVRKIDTAGMVTTYAGTGNYGYVDGPASIAEFGNTGHICFDDSMNLYITDWTFSHSIRKIDTLGNVTTFAGAGAPGYADGNGQNAYFSNPQTITFNKNLQAFFVADRAFSFIRKITLAREVTTIAGTGFIGYNNGPGNTAIFYGPKGIVTDSIGNIYVGGRQDRTIRKIDLQNQVSTFAGVPLTSGYQDGPTATALFSRPVSLVMTKDNELLISDYDNYVIRKIDSISYITFIPVIREEIAFAVFPNPAKDLLTIHIESRSSSSITLNILNLMGELVLEDQIENVPAHTMNIDHLKPGMYIIQLMNEKGVSTTKFVKS